ncbi:uncharacterized protein LOC116345778 [Contarinia nasturtii]|uniref:uncharacterized protein LOC116345778 n=1 Tax=Contarinia nasturtii TaxID=265458 RepID=UPI0012D400C2|nr:uncharacterized protein LOC116345778 [Contarinia nasturtii]
MDKSERIKKLPIKFNDYVNENGILLSVHHRLDNHGLNPVQLKLAEFSTNTNILVSISNRKDIYVFDLANKQYWCLGEVAPKISTCFCFDPCNQTSILIGTKYGFILAVDLTIGKVQQKLKSFNKDSRILGLTAIQPSNTETISVSSQYFICHSSVEAVLCRRDAAALSVEYSLFKSDNKETIWPIIIRKIVVHTSNDSKLTIAILLNDDSLCIFQHDSLEIANLEKMQMTKRIHLRDQQALHLAHARDQQSSEPNNNDQNSMYISDVNFHQNGMELWIICRNSNIIVMDAQQWIIQKIVSPERSFYMKSFVSINFEHEAICKPLHSLWLGVSSNCTLAFLSMHSTDKTINVKSYLPRNCLAIKRLSLSFDNELVALILADGSFKVYSVRFLLYQAFNRLIQSKCIPMAHQCVQLNQQLNAFDGKVKNIISHERLLTILSEYDEYPSKYRSIIWRQLLKLPNNTLAYCKLIERGEHFPSRIYNRSFRLIDSVLHKKLKRIITYLCNWSKILAISFDAEDHFLPYFAFPFVKFFSTNMLMCFEVLATILLNQCSLWFEFSPLLPQNYLGLIENLINHFEPSLIRHYRSHSITSKTFAWKLLRTAFSDILVEFQWFKLWDHILSMPSYFLVFVVVAFNCIQRPVLERLKNAKEISIYFDEPCSIDMKRWLQKAHTQMRNCPIALHPKQFIEDFVCLSISEQQYRKILNYPHTNFNEQLTQNEHKQQLQFINQKYTELEKFERDLVQQMVNSLQMVEHQQRMQKVELTNEVASIHHLRKIEHEKQHLILTERQLHGQEAMINILMKENHERHLKAREMVLQKTLCDTIKWKLCDETELLRNESSLRKEEIDQFMKKYNLAKYDEQQ